MTNMPRSENTEENQNPADSTRTTTTAAGTAAAGATAISESPHEPLELESGSPLLYRIVIGLLTALAIFLAVYAWNLGIGSFRRPAPGLWIFVVALLILVSIPGAILVREKFEVFHLGDVSRSLIMAAGLGVFVLLYPWFGFLIAGAVCLVIITRYSALETWRNTWIIAIGTPAVLYVLFGVLFQVSFEALPTFF